MLYLIWKSDPGNLLSACLGHRQVGSLAGPMIAWPLQPSESAGLCSDWTCDQLATSVESVNFGALLATNVVQ